MRSLSLLLLLLPCLALAEEKSPGPGWYLSGPGASEFSFAREGSVTHSGHGSGRLRATNKAPRAFGAILQDIVPDEYQGKRVRFSAYVKTDALGGWAGLLMQVMRRSGYGNFDNMQNRPIRGTTPWTRYEVVLDVPTNAGEMSFGLMQDGGGTSWIDDAKLEVVGTDVPTTDNYAERRVFKNGGFEESSWPVGWAMSGGAADDYAPSIDRKVFHGGHASFRLQAKSSTPRGYGTLMQSFLAQDFRGKRLRLSGWVRGEGISSRADLWTRVQASDSPGDGSGLGGGHCSFPRQFDWKRCDIVFDVPQDGDRLEVGVGLSGAGIIWLDDVRFDEVDKSVPVTNPRAVQPVNLDFEAAEKKTQ